MWSVERDSEVCPSGGEVLPWEWARAVGHSPHSYKGASSPCSSDGHIASQLRICSDCLSKWRRGHSGREFGWSPFSKSNIIGKSFIGCFFETLFSSLELAGFKCNSQCYLCTCWSGSRYERSALTLGPTLLSGLCEVPWWAQMEIRLGSCFWGLLLWKSPGGTGQ